MKQTFLALLTWLACLTPATAADVDSLLYERQENFERFTRQFPTERVYLHFDNTSYYKGESIWYKAYVVRDDNLHHTDLSRILYVELLNPIGYPIETQKLMIKNGQANGSFELKDTLNAGFYEVRAYTAWMLNFTTGDEHGWWRMHSKEAQRQWGTRIQRYVKGNAGIFSRVFPIYERVERGEYSKRRMPRLPKATATMLAPIKDRLKLDFYPEGGNLVRDVPGRVAFQAHNAEGRTLNVAGALYRRGDSIGYFKTDYAGRGVFSVTPDSLDAEELTKGLELRLTYQGRDYSFDLPRPKRRGFSLNVFHSGDQLKVIAARNAKTDGQLLGLSITSRGRTYYYNTVDLQDDLKSIALVDKHSLQTGVNVVTLFTDEGKTIAQRLVFVNNHDMDGYKLTPLPSGGAGGGLAPYQKVALDYQLTDTAGRPVEKALDFSIAVTDGYTREETYDDGNVLSYLLLASEVKGFIPHPEYYFEADDNERRQALDMLLMVQGWTRYDYEQMMSGSKFEPMLDIERGLTFAGRVWDDNDYEQRIFWKQQPNEPYWVYSEMYINGDTLPYRDNSLDDWMYPADAYHEGGKPLLIMTAEAKVDTTGHFRLNMTPFWGKGRIALMLNKESIEQLGLMRGGVNGHNFRWNTIKRPAYLVGKRIEPLNQYSPLPKNYDYYETAALVDPIDRDMFRYGFMAAPKDMTGKLIYYDPVSQTYVTPEVLKKKSRKWSNFRDVSPVCVMDVKDVMAWLSNIYGDIQDFGPRHPNQYASGMPVEHNYNYANRTTDHQVNRLDQNVNYANLNEILYIFGLDGMNNTYVNAGIEGDMPLYTTSTGSKDYLPPGLRFFPIKENFKELRLYADTDNRRLTHQRGRYNETVFSFDDGSSTNDARPLTSIFNFVTDSVISDAHPLPDFMGFRINFQGLTQPAEFYEPNYDWDPEPEETDYRRTVYWNPQVTTDRQGRAHIEFFNNGFSQTLKVSAEGITANGLPVVSERRDER